LETKNHRHTYNEMNSYAQQFIQQYHKTEEARTKTRLYSVEHKKELDRLYDLFYMLQSGDRMGVCQSGCKKPMVWRTVDKGWAAVCDCDEMYWIKTEFV